MKRLGSGFKLGKISGSGSNYWSGNTDVKIGFFHIMICSLLVRQLYNTSNEISADLFLLFLVLMIRSQDLSVSLFNHMLRSSRYPYQTHIPVPTVRIMHIYSTGKLSIKRNVTWIVLETKLQTKRK